MVKFLDEHEILSKTQFGFRKNMGIETTLLNFIYYIQKELNDNKSAISVFINISKVFDVINHKILKKKLNHY